MSPRLAALTLLLVLSSFVGTASAVPTYCSVFGDPNADGLSTSDVTFRTFNSDDCYGVESSGSGGNDSLTQVNNLSVFDGGWEAFVRDNGTNGTLTNYLGINWTLAADNNQTSGSWTLTLADPLPVDLPVTVDILAVLKGGNLGWAGYLFELETFSLVGSNAGTFNIVFDNGGGQIPGLSHMTLYFREGESDGSDGTDSETAVPEPGSLILLGSGLALAASRFRKKKR
jgi:PEP-CTERM motif